MSFNQFKCLPSYTGQASKYFLIRQYYSNIEKDCKYQSCMLHLNYNDVLSKAIEYIERFEFNKNLCSYETFIARQAEYAALTIQKEFYDTIPYEIEDGAVEQDFDTEIIDNDLSQCNESDLIVVRDSLKNNVLPSETLSNEDSLLEILLGILKNSGVIHLINLIDFELASRHKKGLRRVV